MGGNLPRGIKSVDRNREIEGYLVRFKEKSIETKNPADRLPGGFCNNWTLFKPADFPHYLSNGGFVIHI
jgi:hypothetical protein